MGRVFVRVSLSRVRVEKGGEERTRRRAPTHGRMVRWRREGEREGDRTKQKAREGEGDESEPGRNVGFRFDISARGGHESRDLEVEGPLRWVGPTTSCLFAGPVSLLRFAIGASQSSPRL